MFHRPALIGDPSLDCRRRLIRIAEKKKTLESLKTDSHQTCCSTSMSPYRARDKGTDARSFNRLESEAKH